MAKLKLSELEVGIRHKKLTTRELRENLAEALKFTSRDEGKVVLTKNGEERAALISLKDLMILDALDDLRIKDVLNGKFDKKIFWSVLKDLLMAADLQGTGKAKKKVHERGHRTARA